MSPTDIQWTDETWNPLRASHDGKVGWSCVKISEGCANCYAGDRVNKRFGTGLDYTVGNNARVEHFLDEKVLTQPLHWRKPRRVFVCSMTDLFGEWVPDEWLDQIFAVMALAPQHTFQVLTKRPKRMREYKRRAPDRIEAARDRLAAARGWHAPPFLWPLLHEWDGVSAENQPRAEERIPLLLDTPAAVRFVSYEPALGPVDFTPWLLPFRPSPESCDWLIVGGESGRGARPFDLAWARSVVAQCRAAGVAVFVKQLGARPCTCLVHSDFGHGQGMRSMRLRDRHGSDMAEWPEDLRVREFPASMMGVAMARTEEAPA